MKNIFLIAFALLTSVQMFSQTGKYGVEDDDRNQIQPLQEGDDAYQIIEGEFNLFDELNSGPVVLIFYRGHWCPYCTRHLGDLEEQLEQIRELGAQVVAITPENEDYIEKTVKKSEWSSTIIQDKDRSIMQNYGVYFKVSKSYDRKIKTLLLTNIADNNGEEEAFLPIPATYVIGKDRKIKFAHHDANYKERAPVEDIVNVLKKLN